MKTEILQSIEYQLGHIEVSLVHVNQCSNKFIRESNVVKALESRLESQKNELIKLYTKVSDLEMSN